MLQSVAVPCPVCQAVIEVVPVLGAQVACPECEEQFLVASLEPLELSYALDAEEEGWFADDERR